MRLLFFLSFTVFISCCSKNSAIVNDTYKNCNFPLKEIENSMSIYCNNNIELKYRKGFDKVIINRSSFARKELFNSLVFDTLNMCTTKEFIIYEFVRLNDFFYTGIFFSKEHEKLLTFTFYDSDLDKSKERLSFIEGKELEISYPNERLNLIQKKLDSVNDILQKPYICKSDNSLVISVNKVTRKNGKWEITSAITCE